MDMGTSFGAQHFQTLFDDFLPIMEMMPILGKCDPVNCDFSRKLNWIHRSAPIVYVLARRQDLLIRLNLDIFTSFFYLQYSEYVHSEYAPTSCFM